MEGKEKVLATSSTFRRWIRVNTEEENLKKKPSEEISGSGGAKGSTLPGKEYYAALHKGGESGDLQVEISVKARTAAGKSRDHFHTESYDGERG